MTDYQIYLFIQLFHNKFGEELDEIPYYLLYPIIEDELVKFLESAYNTDEKSEYDCMVEYLIVRADIISLRISDHFNL